MNKLANFYESRARVLQHIVEGKDISDTLDLLCRDSEAIIPTMRSSILYFDQDTKCLHHAAAPSLPEYYINAIDGLEAGIDVGSCGTAAYTGERVIVEDVYAHPNWEAFREIAKKVGFYACWSQPILASNMTILGTFAMYFDEVHEPTDEEIQFIQMQAHLASIAIERKKTETAQKESEERFKDFANSAADRFWETDEEHCMVVISDQTDNSPDVLVHPINRRRWEVEGASTEDNWQQLKEDMQAHRSFKDYPMMLEKNDQTRHRLISGIPFFDADGNFKGYRGSSRDVTEAVTYERVLKESVAKFRLLSELSPVGVFRTDVNGSCVYVNERWQELAGLNEEQAYGVGWSNAIHPDDRERVTAEWLQSTKNNERFVSEYRFATPDGRISWLYGQSSAEIDADGNVVGFIGTVTDITEHKQAEEELRKSESRLSIAQKLIKLGYFERDLDSGVSYWSDITCEMFGFEHGTLMKLEDFMNHVHPDDRENLTTTIDNFIISGGSYSAEYRIFRLDGEVRNLVNTAVSVAIDKNGVTKYFGAVLDVTEERRREDQLRQSQKMEAVGQLTGGVAHDFNNLLHIINGNRELLEDEIDGGGKAQQYVAEIEQAVRKAASLTNRLLAFSRKQTLVSKTTDLRLLIDGLNNMLRRTLGETIELSAEHAAILWPATIDPHQFENALVNLAVNARDAMPKGGRLTITTSNITLDESYTKQHQDVLPGDYVKVEVSDTGSGMTSALLELVFEPFFTTKEVGEGSGLGLSMVYGFVKQSNGHITISSEIALGTTVNLYLPRSRDTIAPTASKKKGAEFELRTERILIVEDDPFVRKIPVNILQNQGYQVFEATNAAEAIRSLKNEKFFNLLFTDIVLPGGMSGVEIAEQARKLQPGIKIIYTTGYAENTVLHKGTSEPGITVIKKPYPRDELLKKVQDILKN